jgi:hypothetical protein
MFVTCINNALFNYRQGAVIFFNNVKKKIIFKEELTSNCRMLVEKVIYAYIK